MSTMMVSFFVHRAEFTAIVISLDYIPRSGIVFLIKGIFLWTFLHIAKLVSRKNTPTHNLDSGVLEWPSTTTALDFFLP